MRLLPWVLRRAIRKGRVTLVGPDGRAQAFGDGDGPQATVRVHDASLDWRIALNPELVAAEAFMDGTLTVDGDVYTLLEAFYVNKRSFDLTPGQILRRGLMRRMRRFLTYNSLSRSLRNVEVHYDVGDAVYRGMLDADLQYSCAYWADGVASLEDAQTAKKRRIAAKLRLEPGMRVLDIGCGWGGMALYLAAMADVEVTGVTLSADQLRVARARAEAAGLADRARFELRDYRAVEARFDRVVSVGMMEHVGIGQLPRYMLGVRDRLGPDGLALVHSIVTKAPPGVTGPFIRKHIFPGGYSPALSEVFQAVEASGLWTLDMEMWRLHYADTLREWRRRFHAGEDGLPARYDDRFKRMWDFYLAACEGVFRHGNNAVAQLQLARARDAVPLTRGYLAAEEARLAALEPARLPPLLASAATAFDAAA